MFYSVMIKVHPETAYCRPCLQLFNIIFQSVLTLVNSQEIFLIDCRYVEKFSDNEIFFYNKFMVQWFLSIEWNSCQIYRSCLEIFQNFRMRVRNEIEGGLNLPEVNKENFCKYEENFKIPIVLILKNFES